MSPPNLGHEPSRRAKTVTQAGGMLSAVIALLEAVHAGAPGQLPTKL